VEPAKSELARSATTTTMPVTRSISTHMARATSGGKMPKKSESEKDLKKHKIVSDDDIPIRASPTVALDTREEMVQTISLLESKLVSLSNINCALQSQIDEMSAAYYKLKNDRDETKRERDEVKRDRDTVVQELETLKLKYEKKNKDKKEKKQ